MMWALMAAFVLTGVAGAWRLSFLAQTDLFLSREIQTIRTPTLDRFMTGATWLGSGGVLTAIGLVAGAILALRRRRRESVAAVMSLLALLLNIGLKLLANRPRPIDPIAVITKTYGSSFPSGHAMGSAAVYGTLAALAWGFWGRWSVVVAILLVPLLVGVSRVYLGAHYGYDVMAGWAGGALCVVGVMAWLRAATARAEGSPEAQTTSSEPRL